MLDQLNDDCQLMIISYLELKDQMILWEATKNTSNRLNNNVIYDWQHQLYHILDEDDFKYFDENPEQMNIFLQSIGSTVQDLELRFVTLEHLKRWEQYSFPTVRGLTYTLDDGDADSNGDVALDLVAQLFPGLHRLKPFGLFTWQQIGKWNQLRELDLSECVCNYFSKNHDSIEHFLNCRMLEKIILICDFMSDELIGNLLRLPKLQKLCFQSGTVVNGVIESIVEMRGPDVQQLIFNDRIWDCELNTLLKFKCLRQLTLIEDDGFRVDQLQTFISNLPQLEQLDLIAFQFYQSEIQLWRTVGCCPSLNILNISGMQIYDDFFEFSRRYMEETLSKRSTPLTLCCYNTGVHEQLIRKNFQHSNLKVTFEPLPVDLIDINYIQAKFVPLISPNS